MKRVTGIVGIFIKARDPDALRDWYRRHLGLDVQERGGDKLEESEYGKFGWVMDPESNRVELWEPPPGPLP